MLGDLVYVALGGECDNGNYVGGVVAVNSTTATLNASFYVEPTGSYGGGIWGLGGVTIAAPASGSPVSIWTAAGNSKSGANEWSAYGAIWTCSFIADMCARYSHHSTIIVVLMPWAQRSRRRTRHPTLFNLAQRDWVMEPEWTRRRSW